MVKPFPGASAELDLIGDEIIHKIRVMEALNHYRFGDAPELLAEWESASHLFGPVHRSREPALQEEGPQSGDEGNPAA